MQQNQFSESQISKVYLNLFSLLKHSFWFRFVNQWSSNVYLAPILFRCLFRYYFDKLIFAVVQHFSVYFDMLRYITQCKIQGQRLKYEQNYISKSYYTYIILKIIHFFSFTKFISHFTNLLRALFQNVIISTAGNFT